MSTGRRAGSALRRAAAGAAGRLLPPAWLERRRVDSRSLHCIDAGDFFEVAFGRPPDIDERARLDALVPDGRVRGAEHAHRVLMSFDGQSHPTAFAVRATGNALSSVDVGAFSIWLDADDPSVSAVISDRGQWEPHVAHVLAEVLGSGSTFVDVGANVGYHSFLAASIVGPTGRVLAVEPSPENCRLLELSRLENDWKHVTVLPLALDRASGLRYLTSHIGTNAGFVPEGRSALLEGRGFVVHAATLDEIAPNKVDVVKIDVEGAEFRVIQGGWSTIRRDMPVIVMEFSCEMSTRVSGVDPGIELDKMLDLGYELYVLLRDSHERVRYPSAHKLLETWGDPDRIEDLLLQPIG